MVASDGEAKEPNDCALYKRGASRMLCIWRRAVARREQASKNVRGGAIDFGNRGKPPGTEGCRRRGKPFMTAARLILSCRSAQKHVDHVTDEGPTEPGAERDREVEDEPAQCRCV
jgi:hypothetical protein